MAQTGSTKQWGMTPPMSTALPTSTDTVVTADLIEELKRENNYEPSEATQKRMKTLSFLQRVTQEFVREVSRRQRMPQSQIDQLGGKIYPYGSYRLGVFGPGSDIDTLAVAPKNIKREDFFESFPPILKRMAAPDAISSLTAVPDAFVPIIKLVLNDIEIDLIFASISSLSTIPKDLNLNDNKLLDGLDDRAIKSITGPRVTDEILSLVPEPKTFRTALRAVKLWAQRRAIYANVVAYPGGVAWAMLVARVCQLYPHAVGGHIVNKFFHLMKAWQWPTPVLLKAIESGSERTWNPSLYASDRKNLMPVITPAYPGMCATYNVLQSTKTVILREFERGSRITEKIFNQTATWSDLFKKHTFFTNDHKYYLSIIASSTDADAAKAWSGTVESKLRHFVFELEAQKDMIKLARPFTKGFKRVHTVENQSQIDEIRKGSIKYKVAETKTVDNTDPELVTANGGGENVPSSGDSAVTTTAGQRNLYCYTFYIGIDPTPLLEQTKNLSIANPTQNFKEKCYAWPKFNPGLHEVAIVPCKSWQLPDDLFDATAGEVKPTRPKKNLKRSIPPDGEAGNQPTKRQAVIQTNGDTPTPVPVAPSATPALTSQPA